MKLLVILFLIKLYARKNIFNNNNNIKIKCKRSTTTVKFNSINYINCTVKSCKSYYTFQCSKIIFQIFKTTVAIIILFSVKILFSAIIKE